MSEIKYSTWWRKYKLVPSGFTTGEYYILKWSIFWPFWCKLNSYDWGRESCLRQIAQDCAKEAELV